MASSFCIVLLSGVSGFILAAWLFSTHHDSISAEVESKAQARRLLDGIELSVESLFAASSFENHTAARGASISGLSAVADYKMMYSAAMFLVGRLGIATGVPAIDDDIAALFTPSIKAYQQEGGESVTRWVRTHQRYFPRSVISITAKTEGSFARIDYGSTVEILQFEQKETASSEWPLVQSIHGSFAGSSAIAPGDRTGVEALWWGIRFLHADLSENYTAQGSLLVENASAFGVTGRQAIVEANHAGYAKGIHYSLPYPVVVDALGKVILPFIAWDVEGQLAYTGTDIYESSATSSPRGQISRITTVNHRSDTCYSATTCKPEGSNILN